MAVGAGDLALEGIARGVEGLLAVTQDGYGCRPVEFDGGGDAIGTCVDDADGVV